MLDNTVENIYKYRENTGTMRTEKQRQVAGDSREC